MVMFGGLDADGNRLEDTWEWNGTYWSQMTINGTTPAARILASASYDPVAKRMLLYGGTSADDLSDTWEYDSGAMAYPANVFSINFGAATQRSVTVRGLAVNAVGGGVGYPSGTTSYGAELAVWDEGAWVQEDTNTNSEASPGALLFSVTDLVRLGRLFIGNEKVASVSSATTAASGAGTVRGAVSTDYLQATVTYSHAHYFLSEADDTMSWTDAEAECVLRGGHLASVSSAHEQSVLETLLKNVNTTAWIGLGDSASEGSFVWSDGTPYSYTHWYTGEPNGGAAVDCVSMGGGSPASFYWRDDYCTVLKRYLCEFDK
jgi:C-type mannose receptor